MMASNSEADSLTSLFQSIGLTEAKAKEATKSPKSAAILKDMIQKHDLGSRGVTDKQAGLIVTYAIHVSKSSEIVEDAKKELVLEGIVQGQLKSVDQVNAAAKYVQVHPLPVDRDEYEKHCGIGFSITPEAIEELVSKHIAANGVDSWANLGAVLASVKTLPELRWANPLDVKNAVEKAFTGKFGPKGGAAPKGKVGAMLGPKGGAAPKGKKAQTDTKETVASPTSPQATTSGSRNPVFEEGFLGNLHKPGGNPQVHPHLREAHLATTGGQVWTRFPPEPNGFLHIGHSKAMFVNFGYAAYHGGKCYLRYDDTNPETEEPRYVQSILDMIRWLGFEPWKVTYASDYFDELYALAVELIKRDKAYVCHCTALEIGAQCAAKRRLPCVHRSRSMEESLLEFENMRMGKYRPSEAILRMKQDLDDPNSHMWDRAAYRIIDASHHRTGDKWKIYPNYAYAHCLCDSIENISHSLCTTEFVASRQSYEWLCDVLEVYKARQSEYGRLNLEGTVMSKRKIIPIVKEGYATGWDDPRLYTLIALRRRGIPPTAIVDFVSTLGVTTADSNIEIARFEHAVRRYLEMTVPRLLMVLHPLKLTIENLPEDYVVMVDKQLHPKIPALGTTTIPFTRTMYIEADDFRLQDSKDYFRLAPGKTVGLFQAPYPVTCTSFKTHPISGDVVEVICRLEDGTNRPVPKPKAYIQWVAEHAPSGSPVRIDEARVFHPLFKSSNPLAVPDGYMSDIDPDSLEVIKGAMVEVGFWPLAKRSIADARRGCERRMLEVSKNTSGDVPPVTAGQLIGNECIRFQGLRVAYFTVDKDATVACLDEPENGEAARKPGDYLVLNRIISLKEDSGKFA